MRAPGLESRVRKRGSSHTHQREQVSRLHSLTNIRKLEHSLTIGDHKVTHGGTLDAAGRLACSSSSSRRRGGSSRTRGGGREQERNVSWNVFDSKERESERRSRGERVSLSLQPPPPQQQQQQRERGRESRGEQEEQEQ